MLTTATPARSLSIAILNMDEEYRAILQRSLGLLGHQATTYDTVSELQADLDTAGRFDLLLLRPQDQGTHQDLCAASNSLNMPALLVLRGEEWTRLSQEIDDFAMADAIDLDAIRSIDLELDWRLRTLVSRSRTPKPAHRVRKERSTWGQYKFLLNSHTVLNRGQAVQLSSFEFTLALELFRNIDRTLARDWLMRRLWAGKARTPDARTLDVYATKVRKKLELTAENGFVLHGVYKQGYQLIALPPTSIIASDTSV